MTHSHGDFGTQPSAALGEKSSTLLFTLSGAGAIVGLAIVLVYIWTLPTIERYKSGILRQAIAEVLHEPARCDTLFLVNGALVGKRPAGTDDLDTLPRIFRGFHADGTPAGFAIAATEVGFSDPIEMLFGYEPQTHALLGLKILVSKETPGIADKIEKPPFLQQFARLVTPLVGTKTAPAAPGDVAMISGATISSRAVIRGINKAIDRWQPLLDAYAAQKGSN